MKRRSTCLFLHAEFAAPIAALITRVLPVLALLVLAPAGGLSAAAQQQQPSRKPEGALSGTVEVRTADGKRRNEPSIVTLEPLNGSVLRRKPQEHIVVMQDKRFKPRYLAAQTGDSLVYVNFDDFDHNVFSPSRQDEFDLGSYPFRAERSHLFEKPGLSKVYCNVHSTMASFVMVYENGLGAATEENGAFRLEAVPAGRYRLKVWNLRGELEQEISLAPGEQKELSLRIEGAGEADLSHPNKFGKPYSGGTADEIY